MSAAHGHLTPIRAMMPDAGEPVPDAARMSVLFSSSGGCGIRTNPGGRVNALAVFKTRSATLLTCGYLVTARILDMYSTQLNDVISLGCAWVFIASS
jgi:hypothetical protein